MTSLDPEGYDPVLNRAGAHEGRAEDLSIPTTSRNPPSDTPLSTRPLERRLKICMLAACPFPANHGTPGSIREMAESVAARGHEVHIVTYHFGEDISIDGPRVHRITPLTGESSIVVGPTVRRPLYDAQMVFKAIRVIREYRLDLIHAHGYEAALVARLCRVATRRPVVYSAHNTMADELPSYDFIRPKWLARAFAHLLDSLVPRLADRCIPHSENLERFLSERGLQGRTEPVIHFGIDTDWPAPREDADVRRRHRLGEGPVILYAGVMDEFQRLDLLLEAMVPVLEHEPRARLLVVMTVPDAKHRAAFLRRAGELGILENVVVTDPQPFASVREILRACDVAVVPRPRTPGFPIKLLNYMVARKPCVLFASSASGLTHGKNACLAPVDTGEALGEAILEVLRDGALRERLGRNAYRFVRAHHDRRVTAGKVCNSYLHTLMATATRRKS